MAAGELSIKIEQGAAFTLPLTFKQDGVVVPLVSQGWSAHMQIRRTSTAKVSSLDFHSEPNLGTDGCRIVMSDTAPNLTVKAKPRATRLLDFSAGVYDLFLTPPGSDPDTEKLLKGTVEIDLAVTREG